jgi:hypothetical protein
MKLRASDLIIWEDKTMALIAIEEYKDAMRSGICSVCVCFAKNRERPAQCVHEDSGQCTLFGHLGEVVQAISSVHSDSIEGYTEVLRREVCTKCDHQNERGICNLRNSRGPVPNWCILDAYFNVIVGVVEDVEKARAGATS